MAARTADLTGASRVPADPPSEAAARRLGDQLPIRPRAAVPDWTVRVLAVSSAILAGAGVVWLAFWIVLRLPFLSATVATALLLAALMSPLAHRFRRAGSPPALSALAAVLALLAILSGIGLLVGFRAAARLQDLTRPLGAAVDRIRVWLVDGPLGLDPAQVTDLRNQVLTWLYQLSPTPAQAARTGLYLLSALVLVLFLVFFLLKDGAAMWAWVLTRVPARRSGQVDDAGRCAWHTLSRYTVGVVLVAVIDALGIGGALFLLDVPLWLSLTLLTFLGAFVPMFGATVSGVVAVLVTLVTNDVRDALVVLVVVLVVQQVEGYVLHPLIMRRAVHLHPAVVLVGITAGTLLFGLAGALLATPVLAVAYAVAEQLRSHPAVPDVADSAATQDPAVPPAPAAPAAPGGQDARPVPVHGRTEGSA